VLEPLLNDIFKTYAYSFSTVRKEHFMKKQIAIVSIATGSLVGGLMVTPATAAYTVKPKVGQCFMQTRDDVSAPYAQKNPINCSKTHNAETYIVAKWPLSVPPEDLPEGEGLEVAESLCRAWGKGGVLEASYFTFWAWFTPDPVAWAKGERWLRCDAMKTLNETEPYKFVSWKGQKLKVKKNI
jgi:hypothetical protein